jgi:hypothetical protein
VDVSIPTARIDDVTAFNCTEITVQEVDTRNLDIHLGSIDNIRSLEAVECFMFEYGATPVVSGQSIPAQSGSRSCDASSEGSGGDSGGDSGSDSEGDSVDDIQDVVGSMLFKSKDKIDVPLSPFALLWSALDEWCSAQTLEFIHSKPKGATGTPTCLEEDFTGDYHSNTHLTRTKSQEMQRMEAMLHAVSTSLSLVRKDFTFPAEAERGILRLIDTFSFKRALPSLTANQWYIACLVFFIVSTPAKTLHQERDETSSLLIKYGTNVDELKVLLEIFKL